MQSGASQCTWSAEDLSCSLTNPPSDIVFIILVALLTMLLSIPVLVFLSIVLEEFASKTPGLLPKASKSDSRKERGSIEEETAKLQIQQSDFARVIRKSVEEKDGERNSSSKSDTAHYAYAGRSLELISISKHFPFSFIITFLCMLCMVICDLVLKSFKLSIIIYLSTPSPCPYPYPCPCPHPCSCPCSYLIRTIYIFIHSIFVATRGSNNNIKPYAHLFILW